MNIAPDCRNSDDLQRFLLGQLPAPDAEQVQAHLAACPKCLDTVSHLQASDTLVEAMRAQAVVPAPPEAEAVERLIDKLSGLYRASDTSAVKATTPGGTGVSRSVANPAAPSNLLAPPQAADELGRLGTYRVLRVLGAGGMGIVFEAEDPQLKRRVALKVMRPELAQIPASRERFLREAQAAAAIEHDHIVTIHQVGEDRGVPFLAMPLLKGETLEDRLRRAEGVSPPVTLPLADASRITREIAAGLAAAHAAGLTHRDIKPANIWLEKTGRVKILDFGLARPEQDDAHLTQTGSIAGTPQYMAPEQAAGQPVDHLSDLFSLGCVLYRLLTGRLPFRGPNTLAVLSSLALEQPPLPYEIRPEVPRALSDLTMRLLAKKPPSRPQSAEAVVEELAEIEKVAGTLRVPLPNDGTQSVPTTLARRRAFRAAAALLLLLAAPVAAWYAPTIYRIATNQGLLVIQTGDPDVEVTVKQNGELVQIVDRRTGKELTLKAGTYQLELSGKKKDGLKLQTHQFTLTRGDIEIVKVWREPLGAVAIAPVPPAESPGPLVTAPAASPARPFVILAREGRAEQQLATLSEAAAAANSGDMIEIRGNGPFETPAIDLGTRALVIRAGAGFEPVLQIDANGSAENLPLLTTTGPLVLEGLHFRHIEQRPAGAPAYILINSKSAPISVAHCRYFVSSNRHVHVLGTSPLSRADVRHCEFAGSFLNAISWTAIPGNELHVSDCLSWGATTFLITGQVAVEQPRGSVLRIHRNTFVGYRTIQHYYAQLPAAPPPAEARVLRVDARENVFNAESLLGLVRLDADEFQPEVDQPRSPHLVSWSERKNLYTGKLLMIGPWPKTVDAIQSLEDWQAFWSIKDTGSLQGLASYQGGDVWKRKTTEPEKLLPADFRLHAGCPGKGAGENGRDLGADVDQVGPGPAYEAWKGTPEYQTWLAATGQTTPFVVLSVADKSEQLFSNLAAAVAAAKSGDTIEIRGNGPFVTPRITIHDRRALVIRAGAGFEPLLVPDSLSSEENTWLLSTNGPLVLEGLHFRHSEDPALTRGIYTLVRGHEEPVSVAHCRFFLKSSRNNVAVSAGTTRVAVRHCEFAGAGNNAISWVPPSAFGELEVSDCLCWGFSNFIHTDNSLTDAARDLAVKLERNTFVGINAIASYYSKLPARVSPDQRPFRIETRENVLDSASLLLMMVAEKGPFQPAIDRPLIPLSLAWRESQNLHTGSLLYLGRQTGQVEESIKALPEWNSYWGLSETGSLRARLRFEGGDVKAAKAKSPDKLKPADFRLHKNSDGKGSGPGGRDLGADVAALGPGPAYEAWRQTPAYQEWLLATGQSRDPEPFVVLAPGAKREYTFASLAEALDFAHAGDVIEIRASGTLLTEQVSIKDKALTIRAGIGFTPVLQPSPAAVQAGKLPFLSSNAPLVLEGLEFRNLASDGAPNQPPLVSLYKGTLHMSHCRLAFRSQSDGAPAVFARAQHFDARHCQFASAQSRTAVDWRPHAPGARLILEDCLISNMSAGLMVVPDDRDFTGVTVRLARNTFFTNLMLGFYFDEKKSPAAADKSGPISVEATENVFDAPLVLGFGRTLAESRKIELQPGLDVVRQRLTWLDRGNLYRRTKTYVQLGHAWDANPGEFVMGLVSLAEWHSLWEAADTGSLEDWPRYAGGLLNARTYSGIEELPVEDFRLQPASPGQGAGENGRDLGADISLVGPGPAYDHWRKTPEYQEWLKRPDGGSP